MTQLDMKARLIRSQLRLILGSLVDGHVLHLPAGVSLSYRLEGDRMPAPEGLVTDTAGVFVRTSRAYWTPLCSLDTLVEVLPAYFEDEMAFRAFLLTFRPIHPSDDHRDLDIPVVHDDFGSYELGFAHYSGTDRLAVFQVNAVTEAGVRELSMNTPLVAPLADHQFCATHDTVLHLESFSVAGSPRIFSRVGRAAKEGVWVVEVSPHYRAAFERVMAEHVANGMGTTQIMADEPETERSAA